MKPFLLRLAAAILSLSTACRMAAAFNPAIAAEGSKWVVYVDVAGLRESPLVKEALDTAGIPQGQININGTQVDFSKLLATLESVTAYGTNISADPKAIDGTLVVQGTPQLRSIVESFLAQATLMPKSGVDDVKDLPYSAYSIGGEVVVAFPPEPIILASKSRAQIEKAREVFRGAAPSLAKNSKSPLAPLLPTASGSLFFAASVVPTEELFKGDGPEARILQMAQSGAMAYGEKDGIASAHVQLLSKTEAMADKLVKILDGMTALVSLVETNNKDIGAFLNAASVRKSGSSVALDFSYPIPKLATLFHTMTTGERPAPIAATASPNERVLSTWQTWADPAGKGMAPTSLSWQTAENVHLTTGITLRISALNPGNTNGQNNQTARVERIEVSGGGLQQPLVFRAEYMKLSGFRAEDSPLAVDGRLIYSTRSGESTAEFQFPGAEGDYTLRVSYVNEPQGKTTFVLKTYSPVRNPNQGRAGRQQ